MKLKLCARCAKRNKIKVFEKAEGKGCSLCFGIFEKIKPELMDEKPCGEFSSFSLSITIPEKIEFAEEKVWSFAALRNCRSIKGELIDEVRKTVEEKWNAVYDFENPDVNLIFNFEKNEFTYEFQPLFVYGKYKKLSRELSQSRWKCRECNGRGCKACGNTGKLHISVEELLGEKFMRHFEAKDAILHGAGREDIDALMLGEGRPFVMEVLDGRKRRIDLKKLEEDVNKSKEIQAELVCFVKKEARKIIHAIRPDKTYRAVVSTEETISEDSLKKLKNFERKTIIQRTPERVSHRRADLFRERKIKRIDCKLLGKNEFEITIIAQAGTYIKEFISGDSGRTKPCISEMFKVAKCKELDVVGIDSDYVDFLIQQSAL